MQPRALSPARAAAFEILQRIAQTSAHSDDLLHGPRLAGLSQPDRDLTTALVLGVLRWQIALDARLRPLLSRPDVALPLAVSLSLRLGAFQLLHMDRIPPHAALNESVELVRAAGQPQAAGMVNAVLRRLVGAPVPRRPLVESTPAMAERLGHPEWLVKRWVTRFGRRAAEQICSFDQSEPVGATIFPPQVEGAMTPSMDAGSRLVAELAAASAPEAARAWDCCAAPGGKTAVLGQRLQETKLLATDSSEKRLRRLDQKLKRELPEREVQILLADAAELPAAYGVFDLILCDVPCSGTGTLARNPEIRHRLHPDELQRQRERQTRLLRAALQRLAPGGRLVYSTCSLETDECEAVVKAVMQNAESSVQQVPLRPAFDSLVSRGVLEAGTEFEPWLSGEFLRTLPGSNFQGDGFFAALFTR